MDKNNPKFFLPQVFLFITCYYYDGLESVVAITPGSGHLWEGRFYLCALDNRGFWPAAIKKVSPFII